MTKHRVYTASLITIQDSCSSSCMLQSPFEHSRSHKNPSYLLACNGCDCLIFYIQFLRRRLNYAKLSSRTSAELTAWSHQRRPHLPWSHIHQRNLLSPAGGPTTCNRMSRIGFVSGPSHAKECDRTCAHKVAQPVSRQFIPDKVHLICSFLS